jgi:ribosome-binding factor A
LVGLWRNKENEGERSGDATVWPKGRGQDMDYKRADRVRDLLLQELSYVLQRKVKDPRLGGITLTRVEVTADLRYARVFYSVLATEEVKVAVAAGLERARGYVKRELGRRLQLRRMPDIAFCYDDSLEYGSRIHRLLSELKKPDVA